MDTDALLEPFERLLGEVSPPARVRAIERDGDGHDIWAALDDSGFLDALVTEQHGGSGLSLAEVETLWQVAGRYALPVPFGETVVARALLAAAGASYPRGPIVVLAPTRTEAGYRQRAVMFARTAQYALLELGDQAVLTTLAQATLSEVELQPIGHATLTAHLTWQFQPPVLAAIPLPLGGLRALAATVRAADIAGAVGRLLDMTVAYAGTRVQFGKPIGKQQAIQQQLAVMGEQVVMARMASQLVCANGLPPAEAAVAIAKHVCSAAVVAVTGIAHAVHGAIGVSEEYDLQLYVRRLYDSRLADGSERYWAARLGALRLASPAFSSVDFVRDANSLTNS